MTTDDLLARHPVAWLGAIHHQFLDAVRLGSLSDAGFRTWLSQDYLFVIAELRFQAGLLRLAPRRAQALLAAGAVALECELTWLEARAAGLTVGLAATPLPATARYRDYLEGLLEAGWGPAITALWALELAYLEAWRYAAPGAERYREFVGHWTDPAFARYVQELSGAVGAEADESAFLHIAEREHDFWEMAWSLG